MLSSPCCFKGALIGCRVWRLELVPEWPAPEEPEGEIHLALLGVLEVKLGSLSGLMVPGLGEGPQRED